MDVKNLNAFGRNAIEYSIGKSNERNDADAWPLFNLSGASGPFGDSLDRRLNTPF